jgi:small conductance mechanosensitive channel
MYNTFQEDIYMNLFLLTEASGETSEQVVESSFSLTKIIEAVVQWCATSGLKLLIGLIVLFIVFKVINSIAKGIRKSMEKRHADETITKVSYSIIRKVLKAAAFILFLGYVGIDTAGIGSIIASCAVAVGLALQGSLSNIAGWFIIIFMKPFKLSHYVECQGVSGTVEDIQLFYTYLRTPDNKVIMVPNGALANGNIINYSVKKTRRVDLVFSISYSDDIVKSINVIKQVVDNHPLILQDQDRFVRMSELASSSINIACRVWVKQENYWTVYFDLLNDVKAAFDANNITIPFNQLDVHVNNEK